MAQGTQPRFDTNGELRAFDGTGAPVSLSPIPYMEGDVKVTGLGRRLNQLVPVEIRGIFVGAGYGGRRFPQITCSEKVFGYTAAAAPGPFRDFATGTGAYATNISTLGNNKPYCIHVELKVEGSEYNDADDVWKFLNVHFEHDLAEGRPSSNGWTGIVLGAVQLNGVTVYREINSQGI